MEDENWNWGNGCGLTVHVCAVTMGLTQLRKWTKLSWVLQWMSEGNPIIGTYDSRMVYTNHLWWWLGDIFGDGLLLGLLHCRIVLTYGKKCELVWMDFFDGKARNIRIKEMFGHHPKKWEMSWVHIFQHIYIWTYLHIYISVDTYKPTCLYIYK